MKNFIKNILINLWKSFSPKSNQDFLFIMGHPRSGSSLLMHILESNDELIGYGEYFIKYKDSKSLLKSEFDIRRKSNQLFKKCNYIVNQVNHHSVTPNLKILISKTNKHILLIRNPEDTLSSMIKLSDSVNQPMSQEAVTSIYIERLEYLKNMIGLIDPLNWIFISYDDLIDNPEENLKNITYFLDLKEPLKKEYQLKRFTQKWGDPSKNITKGKIFKPTSDKVIIETKLLKEASKVYTETYAFLKSKLVLRSNKN